MKKHYPVAALALVAIAAFAQPAKDALADIRLQIQEPLKQLRVLEADEKKLALSEDAQIFAAAAEKKQRARLKDDVAAWTTEAGAADRTRDRLVAEGCPTVDTLVSAAVAQRCNPQTAAHAALVASLKARAAAIGTQVDLVNQLQANISATVLQNSAKRTAIGADRARLTGERDRLQTLAVAEVIRRSKPAALRACGPAACCHSVIYDNASPNLCGLEVLCQSFQRKGLFGVGEPICAVGTSPVPAK